MRTLPKCGYGKMWLDEWDIFQFSNEIDAVARRRLWGGGWGAAPRYDGAFILCPGVLRTTRSNA